MLLEFSVDVAGTKSLKNILLACVFQVLNWFLDFEVFRGSALRWPSLQALRAETMVDGLPRACRFGLLLLQLRRCRAPGSRSFRARMSGSMPSASVETGNGWLAPDTMLRACVTLSEQDVTGNGAPNPCRGRVLRRRSKAGLTRAREY